MGRGESIIDVGFAKNGVCYIYEKSLGVRAFPIRSDLNQSFKMAVLHFPYSNRLQATSTSVFYHGLFSFTLCSIYKLNGKCLAQLLISHFLCRMTPEAV